MSLITRNAEEYRSMTAQLMSQNLPIVSGPFGIFCVLRHPNHFVFAGANNRNVIITYRFLAGPFKQIEIFSIWLYISNVSTFLNIRARKAKSLRGQKTRKFVTKQGHRHLWSQITMTKRNKWKNLPKTYCSLDVIWISAREKTCVYIIPRNRQMFWRTSSSVYEEVRMLKTYKCFEWILNIYWNRRLDDIKNYADL